MENSNRIVMLPGTRLFKLDRHFWGAKAKIPSSQLTEALKIKGKSAAGSKLLLTECKEYGEIKKRLNTLYKATRFMVVRSMWQNLRWIKVSETPRMDAFIKNENAVLKTLENAFLNVYDAAVEADRDVLNGIWSPDDYPAKDELRGAFYLQHFYLEIASASGLPDGVQENADAGIEVVKKDLALIARNNLIEDLLTEIVGRPGKPEDSIIGRLSAESKKNKGDKFRTFRDTFIEGIKARVIDSFDARNVTEDVELASAVQRLKDVMAGVSLEDLRDEPAVRMEVREEFEGVSKDLQAMLTTKRRFSATLSDEEEA